MGQLIKLLVEATKRAPALMFAWFIVGLVVVIAIVNQLQVPYLVAIIGVCVLIMFVVIARLILVDPVGSIERIARSVLVAFTVVAFMCTIATVASALVFHRPDIFNIANDTSKVSRGDEHDESTRVDASTASASAPAASEGATVVPPQASVAVEAPPVTDVPASAQDVAGSQTVAIVQPGTGQISQPPSPTQELFKKLNGEWVSSERKLINASINQADSACDVKRTTTTTLSFTNVNSATNEIEGDYLEVTEDILTYVPNSTPAGQDCASYASKLVKIDDAHFKETSVDHGRIFATVSEPQPELYMSYISCEHNGYAWACPPARPPDGRYSEGALEVVNGSALNVGKYRRYLRQ